MQHARRPLSALGALVLFTTILPFTAAPVLADSPASVPAGFADEALFTGLDHPMSVVFAPNGNVFVAEKRGVIMFYSSVSDTTPTVFADLNQNVHNFWDRGLMGLAVDPGYPAQPYVYVLYSYNHILGDPAAAPRWPSADALVPPGSKYDDRCTNPPKATGDGCVISGRLSRLTASGGVMTGTERVLVEDWCQQFPSHSQGSLMFGPEGALYASSGDGASFNDADYGQFGGQEPNTPTPRNPCGDPGGSNPTPPSAEGGALRSQDLRTSGDPVTLDGSVIRIDPDSSTGAGWSANFNHANSDLNARRIIAYGLRNPFRFTIKPGSNDVWVGDVGYNTWEEINTFSDPDAAPKDFGWPCYEGDAALPAYAGLGLSICNNLNPADVTQPYYRYNHSASVVSGDGCSTGSSSTSGLAFLSSTSGYPNSFDGALFMTDYSRKCIWYFPAGPGGQPDASAPTKFANLNRAAPSDTDGGAVFLTTGPTGDLVYADYDRGEIRQIHYYGANVPPVASFTATPSSGSAPLSVSFNASGSTDANHDALSYAWDLDGDGQYDDATGVTASRVYSTPGDVEVGLQVKDPPGLTSTTSRTVSVGNSPPTAKIDTPSSSLTWSVGDVISFTGSSTDQQDGTTLPPSAYQWSLAIRHCPSDCHSHIVQTYTGLKSGTIDAPDHEYPSHLQLSLTVTDSGGLTDTKMVELFPKTGTVAGTTSPAGIPITVGPNTGAPPPAVTEIVNSHVTVAAPVSAVIGEGTWTFQKWSDSGARTHAVPVGTTPKTVIATYTLTANTDRSNTCSGAPAPTGPSGLWQSGRFGSTNDADWYRFKLTATTRVRLVLGNLPVAGRMELYRGCSTLLGTSDRAGTGFEEIISSLRAGSYAVRLSGSGTASTPNYVFLMKKMPGSVHVLSSRARVDGGALRLVGEVYNNTSHSVGSVIVTAKLYNASGKLLATRSARADLSYMPAHGRSSFSITGSLPAGYDHVSWSVKAPATSKRVGAPSTKATSSGPNGSGHWAVTGTVKNTYSGRVNTLRVGVTLYDAHGSVLDVRRASVGRTTLASGATTSFSATFIPTGLTPDRVYVRGMVFR